MTVPVQMKHWHHITSTSWWNSYGVYEELELLCNLSILYRTLITTYYNIEQKVGEYRYLGLFVFRDVLVGFSSFGSFGRFNRFFH
jgi:hypothetical protein